MKKSYLLLITIMIILCTNINSFGDELNTESIKIAGDNRFPPYHYVNDNGIYKGFSVDIIHAIAIEMGIDVELIPMPFYTILDAINENQVDVILGLEKREEYDEYVFSDSYLTMSKGIFVKNDNKYIAELEDLSDLSVIVQRGNVTNEMLRFINLDNAIFVDNQQQGILTLMMGNAEVFVGNRITGQYTIQKWKQTNFIKVVGAPIEPVDYCFAANKENQDMINMINEGIELIKKNGTYDKIYAKWFGEILKTQQEIQNEILKKFILIIGGIFLVGILIVRTNMILKGLVKKRTKELNDVNKELLTINDKLNEEYVLRQKIINSVFHGIVIAQKDGNIIYRNHKADNLSAKFNSKDAKGENFWESFLNKIVTREEFENVFTSNEIFMEQEKILYLNDVKKIWTYSLYPITWDGNVITEAIFLFKDITREKRIQEQLIQRDKMNALGEFMAVVAHEIRNPLTTIKTYVELIPTKIESKKFKEKLLHYIPSELNRIEQLVTGLLDYSKPTVTKKIDFEINYLIQEVIQLFSERFSENNINTHLNIQPDIHVFADRNQIKQVLINILSNSTQAIKHNEGLITINLFVVEMECVIEIIDNGKGIEQENIHQIFEPFFTSKKSGTGLGLAICQQIIKENEGSIDIQSKLDEWTIAKIQIPRLVIE